MPTSPTELTLTSSIATALKGIDGILRPRVLASYDTPLDGFAIGVQLMYKENVPGTVWIGGYQADISLNSIYVGNVVAGSTYLFRVRSVRANGATGPWLESDPFTVGLTLSSITSSGINPNSPYNTSNTATVDSIVENAAATIRIYGAGGDGSTFLRYQGATSSAMNGAHLTGNQFTTIYFIVFDTLSQLYLAFTNFNDTLADSYIFIGQVITCAADYTGGTGSSGGSGGGTGTGNGGSSGGGGGGNEGGGRNPVSQPVQQEG